MADHALASELALLAFIGTWQGLQIASQQLVFTQVECGD
jgi:hypothetical protein